MKEGKWVENGRGYGVSAVLSRLVHTLLDFASAKQPPNIPWIVLPLGPGMPPSQALMPTSQALMPPARV